MELTKSIKKLVPNVIQSIDRLFATNAIFMSYLYYFCIICILDIMNFTCYYIYMKRKYS